MMVSGILEPVTTRRAADRAGEHAIALAKECGDLAFLSVVEPLDYPVNPLPFLAAASAALGNGVLWSQPAGAASFAGAGVADILTAAGLSRFGNVAAQVRGVRDRLVMVGDDLPFPIVGGFAFAESESDTALWRDFPDALFVVPRMLLQSVAGVTALRVTVPVTPASDRKDIEHGLNTLFDRARIWAQPSNQHHDAPATVIPDSPRARLSGLPHTNQPGPLGPGAPPANVASSRSIPERREWESSVATAVSLIRQGALDKVVLAREERLHAATPFSPIGTLMRLRDADQTATLIALQAGGSWFVGATPERLVRLARGRVDVTCLAGSIGIGESEQEREKLATWLLASDKDRHEHEIVVASTMAALAGVCETVTRLAGTPRVVAARSVQHLETPVHGRLTGTGHVLDLVERLHPTPAVGGYPRERALPLIHELEAIERGWYAGPFGWTDLDGSGEFSVAIRSALLQGSTASLFAGCGIVADSVPADEFEETRLKLRPMLAALGTA